MSCARRRSTPAAACACPRTARPTASRPWRSSSAGGRPAYTGRAAHGRRRAAAALRSGFRPSCTAACGRPWTCAWSSSPASRGDPLGVGLGVGGGFGFGGGLGLGVGVRGGLGRRLSLSGRDQRGPEVLHGVCAVGSPALGEPLGRRGAAVLAELLERVADAQIARQEGIGIAQRAHRYVLGGPPPDSRQGEQPPARVLAL